MNEEKDLEGALEVIRGLVEKHNELNRERSMLRRIREDHEQLKVLIWNHLTPGFKERVQKVASEDGRAAHPEDYYLETIKSGR